MTARITDRPSVSARVYEFLRSRDAGYQFTVKAVETELGITRHGPVGGFAAKAVKIGMCRRLEYQVSSAKNDRLNVVFEVIDPTVVHNTRCAGVGGKPGRHNRHTRSNLPVRNTGLAHVPLNDLLAEIRRRGVEVIE